MDILFQDLRHALRRLRHDLGFTVAIVLTLAIGAGLNTAVFSVVRSILVEPLPYADPDRLTMLWTDIPREGTHESTSAYANVQDWKAQNRVFEDLATFDPTSLTLTGGDWPEQISAARTSANLFAVLGIAPEFGRGFLPEEERNRSAVVVLSHDLWQRRFGRSTDPIGRTIEIAGQSHRVIGVMPASFAFPDRGTELWIPQTLFADWDAVAARRGTDAWRVLGRLRPDVSLPQARMEMDLIARRLEEMHPRANAGLRVNVVPLHDQVTGTSFRLALWTLFGAVGIVFLIACSNVAHLFLVRGLNRSHELALRVALGATPPRLIRQAVTEGLILSLVAGATGLLLAVVGVRSFIAIAPGNIPRLNEVGVDAEMLVYGLTVSLAAGLLFGIAPALSHMRGASYSPLREGRAPAQRTRALRARRVLIAGQFALAIVLVFGANLLIRSFLAARDVDPGFQSENVLMANLSVESPSRRLGFYEQVVPGVEAIPGVRSAGLVEDLFISGAPNRAVVIEGRPAAERSLSQIRIDAVVGDFFATIGVPLQSGRSFSQMDGADAAPVAIITETMSKRFWPGETPVGKRFRTGNPQPNDPWIEIVGVVGDMRRQGPDRAPIPQVFRPYAQEPSRNMVLLVRAEQPTPGLVAALRTRIAAVDSTVPVYRIATVRQALDGYLLQRRFQTLLLGLFSTIALVLAAVGIYGLIQYSVAQRTREIGVRIALGAVSGEVVWMILRQGLSVALPGIVAGSLFAVWLSTAISALLFGVGAADPASLVATAAILLLTTLAACYIPARRAASVDPMIALRHS